MSDLTLLLKGQLSPADFVVKAAADIKKDTAFFQALPFAKTLETWAIDTIAARLSGTLSPTVTALIVHEIKALLGLNDPTPTAAPAG
jgi:hypothetical protein